MQVLSNKKIMLGLVGILIVIVIVLIVIAVSLLTNRESHPITTVFVTAGGTVSNDTFQSRGGATEEDKEISAQIEIPLTVNLASKSGWSKATECIPGQGSYYKKSDGYPMMTIYDFDGNLIGIYQFSNNKMSSPWEETSGPSKLDGTSILDQLHYGVYLFLLDPTNACDSGTSYDSILASPSNLPSYSIPANSDVAIAQGWPDPIFCSQGRGKYYSNPAFEHILMYNGDGNPIGIYQQSLEPMNLPWRKIPELVGGGGLDVITEEHYGIFIFFADAIRPCGTGEQKTAKRGSSQSLYLGQGVRATPTPYIEPTPTPEASSVIPAIIDKLAGIKTVELTASSEPEGLSFNTDLGAAELSATLTQVVNSLGSISYASNTWINNVAHKGIQGTTKSDNLTTLVPDAVNGNSVEVTVWVTEDNIVKKVKLAGIITSSDSDQATRILDVNVGY